MRRGVSLLGRGGGVVTTTGERVLRDMAIDVLDEVLAGEMLLHLDTGDPQADWRYIEMWRARRDLCITILGDQVSGAGIDLHRGCGQCEQVRRRALSPGGGLS